MDDGGRRGVRGDIATQFESRDFGEVDLCCGFFYLGPPFALGHFWVNFVVLIFLCSDGFEQPS